MDEGLIEEIYNNSVSIVIHGIKKEFVEDIKKGYKDYLFRIYTDINLMGKDPKTAASIFSEFEASKWKKVSPNVRLTELYPDIALKEINNLSMAGYELALKRIETTSSSIDEQTAKASIDKLNELLTKVKVFNYALALNMVSEGTMDYLFACGRVEETSLRIGRSR